MRTATICALCLAFAATIVPAGEDAALLPIPQMEMQALERAIAHERNRNELGSQVLGDLYRLKHRLELLQPAAKTGAEAALSPLAGDESERKLLARLEESARSGNRAALRSLSLYQAYLGNPEHALASWRRMGQANPNDIPFLLFSAYLELALGEYNSAGANMEAAVRSLNARTGIDLSNAVFCTNIVGYRLYTPMAAKDLLPGENTLIYVEIEGADFHTLPDGDSECRLMFGLKLLNDIGRVVWAEGSYGEYNPAFAGPIRDLHTALTWKIPNDLAPGFYRLVVEATEGSSARRGETALEFNVARRATNPETRPTGVPSPDYQRLMRDAERTFQGGDGLRNREESGGMRNLNQEERDIYKNSPQFQRGF